MLSCATLLIGLSVVTAPEANVTTTMPAELREQIDQRMIGQVTYQGTWGAKKFKGEETTQWVRRKTGILIQGYLVTDGKRSNYVILMGWDGGERILVARGFNSEGETWTSQWTKFSKDKWTGHGSGVYQGAKWDSPSTLEFRAGGSRYEDTTDGKPWVAEYTRKAKKAKK
jgi:hypothetical protein